MPLSLLPITSILYVGCTHGACYGPLRTPRAEMADPLEPCLASFEAAPAAKGLPAYVQREF
jgi:hypothetical protein